MIPTKLGFMLIRDSLDTSEIVVRIYVKKRLADTHTLLDHPVYDPNRLQIEKWKRRITGFP